MLQRTKGKHYFVFRTWNTENRSPRVEKMIPGFIYVDERWSEKRRVAIWWLFFLSRSIKTEDIYYIARWRLMETSGSGHRPLLQKGSWPTAYKAYWGTMRTRSRSRHFNVYEGNTVRINNLGKAAILIPLRKDSSNTKSTVLLKLGEEMDQRIVVRDRGPQVSPSNQGRV